MSQILNIPDLTPNIFAFKYQGARSDFPDICHLIGYTPPENDESFPTFARVPPFIYPDGDTANVKGMFRSKILIDVQFFNFSVYLNFSLSFMYVMDRLLVSSCMGHLRLASRMRTCY